MKQAIIDTGVIVALLNKNDNYHQWAIGQWKQAPIPTTTQSPQLDSDVLLYRICDRKSFDVIFLDRKP